MCVACWLSPTPDESLSGYATYMEHDMTTVAANHGLVLPYSHDGVALNRRGDLGREVYLFWLDDMEFDGPYLVVDCAARDDYAGRLRQNRRAEVDAEKAKERGFYGVGPVPVMVLFTTPPSITPN